MDRLTNVLNKFEVPTHELKLEFIQELLIISKRNPVSNEHHETWNIVVDLVWGHLIAGLNKLDDQLLCATCFYAILPLSDKQDIYLTKISKTIEEELYIKDSSKTLQTVSLMYGMFQSSFLIQKNDNFTHISAILKLIFELLLHMGYEYSQYTFLIFKTMKSFQKICGTVYQDIIFNQGNQLKLLNFVNHNWENPVTGVRDMNRFIFQTLLSTLEDSMYVSVSKDINMFYWNKAKYLMVSEIIEAYKGNLINLLNENKWMDGLLNSLYKPGLVSAGADMYFAILKQIKSEDEWCEIFLQDILNIFNGTNNKAIDHFNNYWFITTLKRFPALMDVFIKELDKMPESEQILISKLCVLKQGKKLNITENGITDNNIKRIVMRSIEHCNSYIRILAFDIVCLSAGKAAPCQLEYELMLDYFHNNINSDCTVLRLSMLNSFNNFLTQLHSTFLNVLIKSEDMEHTNNLLGFSNKLQEFILSSFNIRGNYQRKITSVKLCNMILTCFTEIPKKMRDLTRQGKISLMDYLKEMGCWSLSTEHFVKKLVSLLKDPAHDIGENVAMLLLHHYSTELREPSMMALLIEEAVTSMKSKYFYEISCGQNVFKLITNLVIKEKHSTADFKSVEDIFYFAYNALVTEHELKTDVMTSIESGKQLHSFMSILIVVIEACISSSYKLDIDDIMPEFLRVLENVSNQFAWEQDNSTSSDFSKMNDMVENIIANSGFDYGESDQTKISGLHQIVLNCIWLNVKASSDLASILVRFNANDIDMCEKCFNIITHVLETSRHKGAIEAAGSALGRCIQYLTSLPDENKISEVPNKLLRQKLNDLISETNKMSSITRRGAGLSIMVHRIVSSDMKKGKPLFHYFINTLLQVCNTTEIAGNSNQDANLENQVDLPKAIYIHFMTRIVTDSSLASDLMYYSANLGELAFGNLTSPHWQIRNAALQLYGALIPRLIGQKKASGNDEETIATVACDELRTHSPNLWKYILEQLKENNKSDTLMCHSNLVPILNLLASCAKRYSFSQDLMAQKSLDNELLTYLVSLLGSPIHTVRRLTAKCIFNIYEFENICDVLLGQTFVSENFIHGSLMLLDLCNKYYYTNPLYKDNFKNLRNKFREILSSDTHSYLCKRLFEDIYDIQIDNVLKNAEETIKELNTNIANPGVHLWAEARLKKYINNCKWHDALDLLKHLLHQSDYEKYCELIHMKIETENDVEVKVLLEIVDILLSFEIKYKSSVIWRIIYTISLKIDLARHVDVSALIQNLQTQETLYRLRYTIPLTARIVQENNSYLITCIEKLSDFENSDVDMRYIAAIANNELALKLDKLSDSIKVTSIKCAVMLLQDEDEDVRNLSVEYYKTLSKQSYTIQPYICLNNILNSIFLHTIFDEPISSIQSLCTELARFLQLNHTVDEYNPFTNDSKNIYFEQDVLRQLIEKLN